MGDNMEDDDWTPPSAADMKIIEARQERSNQISKLMGEYMLKGYRMLDKICHCGTILLQDRNGGDYCVACSELESECAKDDPVLSSEAARVAAREGTSQTSDSGFQSRRMVIYESALENSLTSQQQTRQPQEDAAQQIEVPVPQATNATPSLGTDISSTALELRSQIVSASNELKSCGSIEMKIQLCNLIKAASEALSALNGVDAT